MTIVTQLKQERKNEGLARIGIRIVNGWSILKDAAFCFPCRIFGVNSTENTNTYTVVGFTDWKHALDKVGENEKKKKRVFELHIGSEHHQKCVASWHDKVRRDEGSQTFTHIVSRLQNDHQKWLEMIFRVTKFLAGNGLPFRGDKEELGEIPGASLFLNSVQQFAFEFQPELRRITKNLPRNAKYLTPDIQNEVIEVLANMVRKKHATAV